MKLKEGRLQFTDGDRIEVESEGFGTMSLTAKKGQKCGECEFCPICDRRNPNNLIGRFCAETHFVLSEKQMGKGNGKF